MAKRKIIKIDEEKCNGCGVCIPNCPEGAMQVINGKARLISDLFCDGLGACIGTCPKGAISIEEREAERYDEKKVMENIVKQGKDVIVAHLKHLKEHGENQYLRAALEFLKEKKIKISIPLPEDHGRSPWSGGARHHRGGSGRHPTGEARGVPVEEIMPKSECGCPGSKILNLKRKADGGQGPCQTLQSELQQWPIQLHLLNPNAPYFKGAELLIAADCVPFSYANFHQRLLKGKTLIIFCPKLDNARDIYLDKLTQILKNNSIHSITLAHMEVPCCFGLVNILEEAFKASGKNIMVKDYTISIQGDIV